MYDLSVKSERQRQRSDKLSQARTSVRERINNTTSWFKDALPMIGVILFVVFIVGVLSFAVREGLQAQVVEGHVVGRNYHPSTFVDRTCHREDHFMSEVMGFPIYEDYDCSYWTREHWTVTVEGTRRDGGHGYVDIDVSPGEFNHVPEGALWIRGKGFVSN